MHRGFERVVAVGADFLGIAVALGGAGLAVAEKMGGCEQLNDFGRGGGAGRPGGEFVAGQLGADELIKWQVAIHRANHPVAIAIGERTVGVGGEVAVGIGIARGVEPVFSPAFTEADGGEVAVGGAGEGVGRVVVREGVEFCERGRQAGEGEGEAAEERVLRRGRRARGRGRRRGDSCGRRGRSVRRESAGVAMAERPRVGGRSGWVWWWSPPPAWRAGCRGLPSKTRREKKPGDAPRSGSGRKQKLLRALHQRPSWLEMMAVEHRAVGKIRRPSGTGARRCPVGGA